MLWAGRRVQIDRIMGRVINRRVDARRFFVYVHAFLIVSAAGLVLQAIVWTVHQPAVP